MQQELTVMILRPAHYINLFRLGQNDFGVENMYENYDELNLIIEGDISESKIPSVRIVVDKIDGKTTLKAVPIEAGQYRWGGKFIYSFDPKYTTVCPYPIPLFDRRNIPLRQL